MYTSIADSSVASYGLKSRPNCMQIVNAYESLLPGRLMKRGSSWEGPCPVCSGEDRFAVNNDGIIWCRHCQPDSSERGKRAFKEIMHTLNLNDSQSTAAATMQPETITPKKSSESYNKIKFARKMFAKGKPIANTKAVDYLLGRCITESADSLRFGNLRHSDFKNKRFPCLLSKITNPQTGKLIGVHRTFFEMEGGYRKRHAGCPKGGGVLVSGSLDSERIVITEGLEDALSIKQATKIDGAVWATCGTPFMKNFLIPENAKFVIIAADSDEPGVKAAHTIGEVAQSLNLHGRIVFTPKESGDWNDLLIAGQEEIIRRKIMGQS